MEENPEQPMGRPGQCRFTLDSEQGKRDSIIVVATQPRVYRQAGRPLERAEEERSRPKSQAELIAEMALLNVEQERRLYQVEEQVETVAKLSKTLSVEPCGPGTSVIARWSQKAA
jgi:hypothetical protein